MAARLGHALELVVVVSTETTSVCSKPERAVLGRCERMDILAFGRVAKRNSLEYSILKTANTQSAGDPDVTIAVLENVPHRAPGQPALDPEALDRAAI